MEADGFLYNMVRAIAGTLINVGRGYWPEDQVAKILQAEDRREAGPTAPAAGLFLMRVTYERYPMTYPDQLEITPLTKPPSVAVHVPGSKSITNRALVLAALQSRKDACLLTGALQSEDTEVMVQGLLKLGFHIDADWPTVRVGRHAGEAIVPNESADIFVGNSGTTMRFLTALCALGRGRYRLDGVPRMRERPIEDLLVALREMGVRAYSEAGTGFPPVIVEADGCLSGPRTRVRGDTSSQFVSALLMIAPFTDAQSLGIELQGAIVSRPYIEMTLAMMQRWGATWRCAGGRYIFQNESTANYGIDRYEIEPDASAASYFFAAAAVAGGRVTVLDIPEHSSRGRASSMCLPAWGAGSAAVRRRDGPRSFVARRRRRYERHQRHGHDLGRGRLFC